MGKKILIIEFGSLVMCGEGVRNPIGISFRGFKRIGLWGLDLEKGVLDQCFPSVFGIVAKFPRWKSGSISPYFRGGNSAALHLRCVIAHRTLFLQSFHCENVAMGMPYFNGKNPVMFWCAMAHQQGFMPMYMARANMLMLGWFEAPQSIKHIDTCCIHGEIDVTWWHGSRRSSCGDYAQSITWIWTYSKCLKHILMPKVKSTHG